MNKELRQKLSPIQLEKFEEIIENLLILHYGVAYDESDLDEKGNLIVRLLTFTQGSYTEKLVNCTISKRGGVTSISTHTNKKVFGTVHAITYGAQLLTKKEVVQILDRIAKGENVWQR